MNETDTQVRNPPPGLRIVVPSHWNSPVPENCIRFVCISDTHHQLEREPDRFAPRIPSGDVLLHAGDFSYRGEIEEIEAFDRFLEKLTHPVKIAIPGNHEVSLDPRGLPHNIGKLRKYFGLPDCKDKPTPANYKDVVDCLKGLIPHAVLLVDAWVEVCGIKIYGLPWLPAHGAPGFGLSKESSADVIQSFIPVDTDILLSHGPVLGYGDLTRGGNNVGSARLANCVRCRVKPRLVVSGHIHEAYGIYQDRHTMYINASICNRRYQPVHKPVVLDWTLPQDCTRLDLPPPLSMAQLTLHPSPDPPYHTLV